nr:hypothetical protein [Pseudomonas syringae pv. theae]
MGPFTLLPAGAWERTGRRFACSRRRCFRRCIFGDYPGPFANNADRRPRSLPGLRQNQKQRCITMSAERGHDSVFPDT